jgi:hypothetical protein
MEGDDMSKIIGIVILIALTLIPLGRNLSSPASTTISPPPNEMEVMVLLSGLMVFHKKQTGDSYEVGILAKDYSPDHDFCIRRLGAQPICRTDLPGGKKWSFVVTNEPGGPPVQVGHDRRRPDKEPAQFDFDWIINLESAEFHGKELTLVKDRLWPIIKLPKAQLFTRYKSHDLRRWRGAHPPAPQKSEPFGFASEVIGFVVKLKRGESLALRDEDKGKEIFNVSYVPPPPVGSNYEVITLTNVRYPPKKESDFSLYYALFSNVQDNEKYDFERNTDPGMETAFNPMPEYSLPISKTCCMLDCTGVLLGTRTKDLE